MGVAGLASSVGNETAAIGFDFGTTNSSVALTTPNSQVQLASLLAAGEVTQSFRSVF